MINWDRVDELREEVGAEDLVEVIELFLEEVEEVISRLQTAPDPSRYEEDLHFLKGSALNLGFRKFGALCEAGEKAAANGQTESIVLNDIIDAFFASKAIFAEKCSSLKVA